MHFGAALHLLRAHAGLSLRTVGARAGVSAAYLSRVEHGHDPAPSPERTRAIADALGLPGDLLSALADDVRLDASGWLDATAVGRRLAAELRRRRLNEAQLARVLAFVASEFPLDAAARGLGVRDLLEPSKILLRVRLAELEDAWTLAALRLAAGEEAEGLLQDLLDGRERTSAVGGGTVISFVHGRAPSPRACLIALEAPLALAAPDESPIRAIWVLAGLGHGPLGALALARTARMADERAVAAVAAARTADEALDLLERFERVGTVEPVGIGFGLSALS